MFCMNFTFLRGQGGKGGRGRLAGGGVCISMRGGGRFANDYGRGATQQGNHNFLRNNVHDDYTIY